MQNLLFKFQSSKIFVYKRRDQKSRNQGNSRLDFEQYKQTWLKSHT